MKTNPILHALAVEDIGAFDMSMALSAARSNDLADAYNDPDGVWIFIATRKPTQRDIRAWKREQFGI